MQAKVQGKFRTKRSQPIPRFRWSRPVRRGRRGGTGGDAREHVVELSGARLGEEVEKALRLKAPDAFGVTREVLKTLLTGEGADVKRLYDDFHAFCQSMVEGALPPCLFACLGLFRGVPIPKGEGGSEFRVIAIQPQWHTFVSRALRPELLPKV